MESNNQVMTLERQNEEQSQMQKEKRDLYFRFYKL